MTDEKSPYDDLVTQLLDAQEAMIRRLVREELQNCDGRPALEPKEQTND